MKILRRTFIVNRFSEVIFLGLLYFLVFSCTNTNDKAKEELKRKTRSSSEQKLAPIEKEKVSIIITKPKKGVVVKKDESLTIRYKLEGDTTLVDSCLLFLNNKPLTDKTKTNIQYYKAGENKLIIKLYQSNGLVNVQSVYFIVISDKQPEKRSYKLIKTYPHNTNSYTQGLLFAEGFLYEGTGQYSESSLQKIQLPKVDLIQSYKLPDNVFGEGIVLFKKHIYQLTWRAKKAFVYNIEDFSLIREFYYETEGWGITNYKDQLVMSDGTQNLYLLDPESFTPISKLQVYNHLGPVNNLNELEWIDGKIWANIYLTNTIVIIDPETGFVEAELDLTKLVPDTYANEDDNVLNGIALDKVNHRIFVTGKRWPKLYHIELVK